MAVFKLGQRVVDHVVMLLVSTDAFLLLGARRLGLELRALIVCFLIICGLFSLVDALFRLLLEGLPSNLVRLVGRDPCALDRMEVLHGEWMLYFTAAIDSDDVFAL